MIFFLGPPGSGKGTQANLLKDLYNLKVFSFGEFLREEVKKNTPFGIAIKSKIDNGQILTLKEIFKEIDYKIFFDSKLILDGFPRSLEQAQDFEKFLKILKLKVNLIVEFNVDYEILLERIKNRKNLDIRNDDDELIFKKRYDFFCSEQQKIKNFYLNNVNYITINANFDKNTVLQALGSCLKQKNLI